jgi:hypothetical protein
MARWQWRNQPTHRTSKQTCPGDVAVGAGLAVDLSPAESPSEADEGVVVGGAAGSEWGPDTSLAATGEVWGCGLVVAVGWAVTVVCCGRRLVGVVATAPVAFRGGLAVLDGLVLVP